MLGFGEPEPEVAAFTRLAIHTDLPALRLNELPGNGEPQPCSFPPSASGTRKKRSKIFSLKLASMPLP